MRLYNPALCKFLSVDPLYQSYPWNSTYAFAENDVIRCIDLDGGEKKGYLEQVEDAARRAKRRAEKSAQKGYNESKKAAQKLYEKGKANLEVTTDKELANRMIQLAKIILPNVGELDEQGKQRVFQQSGKETVAILLYEFSTGTGKDTRNFKLGESAFANDLVSGRISEDIGRQIKSYAKEHSWQEFKNECEQGKGKSFGLSFSPDQTGLLESVEKHLDSNLPQFFTGGSIFYVKLMDNTGSAEITIYNKTARKSLKLHISENIGKDPAKSKDEPLSSIEQNTVISNVEIDKGMFRKDVFTDLKDAFLTKPQKNP